MARLDRLGAAKEVAQLGATIGREFSYELVQAVAPIEETRLRQCLGQLVRAELVYQRGLPPDAHYQFKHALIQDTAYESLLKSARQKVHQQIAHVLEGRFPETAGTQPELVAHHYTAAGLGEQAIPYWQQAGERAAQRSAYVEATAHLQRGLELLKSQPDTPERALQELGFQSTLGPVLLGTKGWPAPETGQAFGRARELCRQVGETPLLFPVLFGLWGMYWNRGELHTAQEIGEQLLHIAQTNQDEDLLMVASFTLGIALGQMGTLSKAHVYLEQARALYNPDQHRAHLSRYGHEPGVGTRTWDSMVYWALGYPDQAQQCAAEALTIAKAVPHVFTLGAALGTGTWVYQFCGALAKTFEQAEATVALSTEQSIPEWLAMGNALRG